MKEEIAVIDLESTGFSHKKDCILELGMVSLNTKTGEIIDFTIVNPTKCVKDVSLEKDTSGDYLIPFHSVIAIGDFLVISEEDIL